MLTSIFKVDLTFVDIYIIIIHYDNILLTNFISEMREKGDNARTKFNAANTRAVS